MCNPESIKKLKNSTFFAILYINYDFGRKKGLFVAYNLVILDELGSNNRQFTFRSYRYRNRKANIAPVITNKVVEIFP